MLDLFNFSDVSNNKMAKLFWAKQFSETVAPELFLIILP